MGSSNDREWLHTAMAFLKTYVVGIKKDILVGVTDVEAYTAKLIEGACQAAAHLQSGSYFDIKKICFAHVASLRVRRFDHSKSSTVCRSSFEKQLPDCRSPRWIFA